MHFLPEGKFKIRGTRTRLPVSTDATVVVSSGHWTIVRGQLQLHRCQLRRPGLPTYDRSTLVCSPRLPLQIPDPSQMESFVTVPKIISNLLHQSSPLLLSLGEGKDPIQRADRATECTGQSWDAYISGVDSATTGLATHPPTHTHTHTRSAAGYGIGHPQCVSATA